MKLSLNWARKFTDVDLPLEQLVDKIGAQLGAVDEVIDIGQRYQEALVVKVIKVEKHPDADNLIYCWIDDGGKQKGVGRNDAGLIGVVCGAPNVKQNMLAVWLPPDSYVPAGFDKHPIKLAVKEIRGLKSSGMLASPKELSLGDNHKGLLVVDKDVPPGSSFAKVYKLDDHIIDIENKMFTHRPDLFGQLGLAREIAGVQQKPFKSPDWYSQGGNLPEASTPALKLEVDNQLPELVPRFMLLPMSGVQVKPSPVAVQTMLSRVGIKPINNVVDITNYLMLETAQPLHAYDYDKLKTAKIGIRLSKDGEQVELLGSKPIKLESGAIVITDGLKPIGLGGIMGGAGTEVDESTTNIILECATFDMNHTRRTAMRYGLFTEAATRFTKNQSPLQNKAVLLKAAEVTAQIGGGRVAGELIDDKPSDEVLGGSSVHAPLQLKPEFINNRLGLNLSGQEIVKLLNNVEFNTEQTQDEIRVEAPFWRTDIEIPEDVVEEVGRLYGYDQLPMSLPSRTVKPVLPDKELLFKSRLRQALAAAGANELLTYSFVDEQLLVRCGQSPDDAYHIRNALSPDLQYYRLSLTPSLLSKIHPNIKNRHDEFCLFELGRTHVKDVLDDQNLPKELKRLALVYANKRKSGGGAYFQARKYCDYLLGHTLGIEAIYKPLAEVDLAKEWQIAAASYEPDRSAVACLGDGKLLGIVGEPKSTVVALLKLPNQTAMAELDLEGLMGVHKKGGRYQPLNKYPLISQDLSLKLSNSKSYSEAAGFLKREFQKISSDKGYDYRITPLDIFQRQEDKDYQQLTWHITMSHPERTMTRPEANQIFDMIAGAAKRELGADRI